MKKIFVRTSSTLIAFLLTSIAYIDAHTAINVRTGQQFSDLQTAINAAQQNDVLGLSGTFKVTSDSFNNNQKNLTLNGVENAVLDGNQINTVFTVNDSGEPVNVVFSNLIIQNGSGVSGGGIANTSDTKNTIILKNVSVINNSASDGGGIYNNGHALLDDSKVTFNQANGTGGAGIFVSGSKSSLSTSNTKINHNTFSGFNGGGAVYANIAEGYINLSFYKTEIKENTSSNAGGGCYFGNVVAQISKSNIENNSSSNTGGGFYVTNSSLIIIDSEIEKNSTVGLFGGGIFASGSEFKIFDSKFKHNTAEIGGGLFLTSTSLQMFNSVIEKNTATNGGGGGIFLGPNSNLYLDHVKIEGNKATDGGGFYNGSGSVTFKSCEIKDNRATGVGGGLYSDSISGLIKTSVTGNNASDGGGIFNDIDAILTLIESEIKHNDPNNISGTGIIYQ